MPVFMICGTQDKLCQPDDYNDLKETLSAQNSLLEFQETFYGHLSILNPNKSF